MARNRTGSSVAHGLRRALERNGVTSGDGRADRVERRAVRSRRYGRLDEAIMLVSDGKIVRPLPVSLSHFLAPVGGGDRCGGLN
jgi:hypothetical protein